MQIFFMHQLNVFSSIHAFNLKGTDKLHVCQVLLLFAFTGPLIFGAKVLKLRSYIGSLVQVFFCCKNIGAVRVSTVFKHT